MALGLTEAPGALSCKPTLPKGSVVHFMRFLLYNIRYGAGIGKRIHFPVPYAGYLKNTDKNFKQIAAFIKSMQPDITGLIEVDNGSFRSTQQQNQAASVAREMQHCYIYQSKYACDSLVQKMPLLNQQGNALVTNQEIKNKQFFYLNNGVKRLVMKLELTALTVYLVHLSLKFGHRQKQLQELSAIIRETKGPFIVAGDFNAFRGDQELHAFQAAHNLANANTNGLPSHPSRAPRRQLDFILHTPEIQTRAFHVPDVRFSDHVPLVYDFDIMAVRTGARPRRRPDRR
jgi:endonuclease/exonuclease/phosphatase family metal-dependent hydrolase